MQGVLLIDKPKGPSSFNIISKIRKLTGIKRVGHAGTLDPEASGLLVIALGSYTKFCGYLTKSAKIYEAIIQLGVKTSTDDAEGEVIFERSLNNLNIRAIHEACTNFTGVIQQIPPQYSAIKIHGKRAYKLARAEQIFSLAAREVEIFSLEIMDISLPQIRIRAHCSKGTYIRALARDIGDFLEVGAYAQDIRRIASGSFRIEHSQKLEDLTSQNIHNYILEGPLALGELEVLEIRQSDYEHIRHGRKFNLDYKLKNSVAIALFESKPVAILGHSEKLGLEILRVI